MTDETRPLYRPGRERPPSGNGMSIKDLRSDQPSGMNAEEVRDYLQGAMIKSLHHSSVDHSNRVLENLRTMGLAERLMIEIEMAEIHRRSYSADYDPLRY